MRKTLACIATAGLAFAFGSCAVYVKNHAEHPAYLHALTDLRAARAHLDKMTPSEMIDRKEMDAIAEINGAIGEIKRAALEDGKNINEHPPVDVALDRKGRFGKAIELLKSARRDLSKEEDNRHAKGLKKRSILHIDNALNILVTHYKVLYPGVEIDVKF
jgi:hypothetical protein